MEDYNKVKDYILKTYLNDDNLNTIKKEAIKKLLKQTKCALIEIEKEENLKLKEWMYDGSLNQLIMQAKQISEFENIEILDKLTYFAKLEDESNNLFYEHFINLYFELKAFKESGIDESNYAKEIQSLENKRKVLQKFSSMPIELDKIPELPSEIIRKMIEENSSGDFKNFFSKNDILLIINTIVSALNVRYKGKYKTKPHSTLSKTEKLESQEFISFIHKLLTDQLSDIEKEEGKTKYNKFMQGFQEKS